MERSVFNERCLNRSIRIKALTIKKNKILIKIKELELEVNAIDLDIRTAIDQEIEDSKKVLKKQCMEYLFSCDKDCKDVCLEYEECKKR